MTQTSVNPPCYLPSANPRTDSCLRCGKLNCQPKKVADTPEDLTPAIQDSDRESLRQRRPRDIELEREVTLLAANAGGNSTDYGLRDFADSRAWPGGVRRDLDCDREALEELADCASYLVWGIVPLLEKVDAGDPEALDKYERRMRALAKLIDCWKELLTEAA